MKIRCVDLECGKIWVARGLLMEMFLIKDARDTGVYIDKGEFKKLSDKMTPEDIVDAIGELMDMADEEYRRIEDGENIAAKKRRTVVPEEKREPDGYVYIIKTSIGTKIGISAEGCIENRMKNYDTMPIEQTLREIYHVSRYRTAELHLHGTFSASRTKGEWFNMSDNDINKAIDILVTEYSGMEYKK